MPRAPYAIVLRPSTPLSAALTAAVKSKWKNGVLSVDNNPITGAGESISAESDIFLTFRSSLSTLSDRGNADGRSLAYGTTAAISCCCCCCWIWGVERLPIPKPPATRARWIQGERIVAKWNYNKSRATKSARGGGLLKSNWFCRRSNY